MAAQLILLGLLAFLVGLTPRVIAAKVDYLASPDWMRWLFIALMAGGATSVVIGLFWR